MIAVVFDLELVKRTKKGQLSEIVEIGACKVDMNTNTMVDQFQVYILPESGTVAVSTRKFINMKEEDVKRAVSFQEGMNRFKEWLGDDYFLCSWGKDDRLHIIDECTRKGVAFDWFINYNDIQSQIGNILTDTKNQLGLKTALELAGIQQVGLMHRGIDDAINTAQLLMLYADQITLERNTNEMRKKKKRSATKKFLPNR